MLQADHGAAPVFGTFSRRFQAMLWDAGVVLAAVAATIAFGAVAQDLPGVGRIMIVALVAELVLYEPLMVARFGGTLGHRRLNLRVVDEATGGNPGFLRSVARYLVKVVLGLPSFTTMALTRRHQAVHDRLTATTVRVRDLALARPADFQYERALPDPALLPSRRRRVAVIGAYLVAGFVALAVVMDSTLSEPCMMIDECSAGDTVLEQVLGLAWMGLSIGAVIAGWRGQLPGARRRTAAANEPAA